MLKGPAFVKSYGNIRAREYLPTQCFTQTPVAFQLPHVFIILVNEKMKKRGRKYDSTVKTQKGMETRYERKE